MEAGSLNSLMLSPPWYVHLATHCSVAVTTVISAPILSGEEGGTLSLPGRPRWCHSFNQQAQSDHTAALAVLCSSLPQACVPLLQWHCACSGVASRTSLWHLWATLSGDHGCVGLRLGLDHFRALFQPKRFHDQHLLCFE